MWQGCRRLRRRTGIQAGWRCVRSGKLRVWSALCQSRLFAPQTSCALGGSCLHPVHPRPRPTRTGEALGGGRHGGGGGGGETRQRQLPRVTTAGGASGAALRAWVVVVHGWWLWHGRLWHGRRLGRTAVLTRLFRPPTLDSDSCGCRGTAGARGAVPGSLWHGAEGARDRNLGPRQAGAGAGVGPGHGTRPHRVDESGRAMLHAGLARLGAPSHLQAGPHSTDE